MQSELLLILGGRGRLVLVGFVCTRYIERVIFNTDRRIRYSGRRIGNSLRRIGYSGCPDRFLGGMFWGAERLFGRWIGWGTLTRGNLKWKKMVRYSPDVIGVFQGANQASWNPCSRFAASSSNVRVAEQPRQMPSEPIKASSNVPVPLRSATTAE
jgi:hypothetical protein